MINKQYLKNTEEILKAYVFYDNRGKKHLTKLINQGFNVDNYFLPEFNHSSIDFINIIKKNADINDIDIQLLLNLKTKANYIRTFLIKTNIDNFIIAFSKDCDNLLYCSINVKNYNLVSQVTSKFIDFEKIIL